MDASIEPFVDADNIAAFLGERRTVVIRMARLRQITSYPFSGHKRHTYKFKRSEVAADMAKIRRPSTTPVNDSTRKF
jgi:hypothetical protein